MRMRLFIGILAFFASCHPTFAQSVPPAAKTPQEPSARLGDFQVIEFRRYTIKEGQRENFARYFDTYFPEAFQQLGAMAAGSFLERDDDRAEEPADVVEPAQAPLVAIDVGWFFGAI